MLPNQGNNQVGAASLNRFSFSVSSNFSLASNPLHTSSNNKVGQDELMENIEEVFLTNSNSLLKVYDEFIKYVENYRNNFDDFEKLSFPHKDFDFAKVENLIFFFAENPRQLYDLINNVLANLPLKEINLINDIIIRIPEFNQKNDVEDIEVIDRKAIEERLMKHLIYVSNKSNLIQETKPTADKVELTYWDNSKSTGHVALKILTKEGEFIYASYWPAEQACFQSVPGTFYSEEMDLIAERGYVITSGCFIVEEIPTKYIVDLSDAELKTNQIINRFISLLDKNDKSWYLCAECIPRLPFSTETFNANCSTLVMDLLSAGGLEKQLPCSTHFGGFWHLLLLCSSRTFITISFLACGLYPVIDDYAEANGYTERALIGTSVLVMLSGISTFILEKLSYRRTLVEIDNIDCVAGMGAAIGYGAIALVEKYLERHDFLRHLHGGERAGLTAAFLTVGSLGGLWLGGKLAILISALFTKSPFKGTSYTISPRNIKVWMEYVKQTAKHGSIKYFLALKEFFSISVLWTGWLACYGVRHSYVVLEPLLKSLLDKDVDIRSWVESGMFALYIGAPIGVGTSYLLTKFFTWQLKRKLEFNIDESEKLKQITVDNYGQKLEQFSLTTLSTALGIMGFLSLSFSYSEFEDPVVQGFMGALGGILGFSIGILIYRLLSSICTCHSTPVHENGTDLKNEEQTANIVPAKKNSRLCSWLSLFKSSIDDGSTEPLVRNQKNTRQWSCVIS